MAINFQANIVTMTPVLSKPIHLSSFPNEIEHHILCLASMDSRSMYHCLFVAKRVHHWYGFGILKRDHRCVSDQVSKSG